MFAYLPSNVLRAWAKGKKVCPIFYSAKRAVILASYWDRFELYPTLEQLSVRKLEDPELRFLMSPLPMLKRARLSMD
jgi:hypothetical protein